MGEREEEREKRLNGHTDKWADRQTDNDYRVMCFFFSIFIFLLFFFAFIGKRNVVKIIITLMVDVQVGIFIKLFYIVTL